MTASPQASKLRRTDIRHVYQLYNQLQYTHIHLDWRDLDDWFKNPDLRAWVTRQHNIASAMLGATIQPVVKPDQTYDIAWLRFMLPYAPFGDDPALHALWHALTDDLRVSGVKQVAALVIESWVEPYLRKWGFELLNTVISLRRENGPSVSYSLPDGFFIREVRQSDLPVIAQLDSRAFEGVWQYPQSTLAFAWGECHLFTLIEKAGTILGYQMSTLEGTAGHLARLAVDPHMQGRGLGKVLVGHAIAHLENDGAISVTVNTQGDNLRSKKLYERFGFAPSAADVPIWVHTL